MVTEGSVEATLLSTGCREHSRQPRIKTAILTFLRKPLLPTHLLYLISLVCPKPLNISSGI